MTDREFIEDILDDLTFISRFDFFSYDLDKTYNDDGSYCNSYDVDDIRIKIKKYLDLSSKSE